MQAHIIVDGQLTWTESAAKIRVAHAAGQTLWVELGDYSREADELLSETFGIHPLVIEDIFRERSVPKIESLDGYLYVVVHALRHPEDPTQAELTDLDLVIGRTFILTQHRSGPATERLRARLEASPQLLERGPAWLAHAFIDTIVDRFAPFMGALKVRIDEAEVRVMSASGDGTDLLPELVVLKRNIQSVCRIADHQREILLKLARFEYREIPKAARFYFSDVHDHFMQVAEEAESSRDIISSAVDAYLNVQSYRMNDTVKRLTLISTVMLPLNLIAGFYGMNITSLPGASWRWSSLGILVLMVAVTAGIWRYFKSRRWV
jgi:magnesium transporter